MFSILSPLEEEVAKKDNSIKYQVAWDQESQFTLSISFFLKKKNLLHLNWNIICPQGLIYHTAYYRDFWNERACVPLMTAT